MASGGNKMTVYHGSSIEVKNPDVIHYLQCITRQEILDNYLTFVKSEEV